MKRLLAEHSNLKRTKGAFDRLEIVMDETFLLNVEQAGQAGDDVLIFPSLPADEYRFTGVEKIIIVTPDSRRIEKEAAFSIPLGTLSYIYITIILSTQKDEVPVGSQILVLKSVEQITRNKNG